MTYRLKHVCGKCGHEWTVRYSSGATVAPVCVCGEVHYLYRETDRGPLVESITSELVADLQVVE